jgi:hypothetical protein
MWEIDGTFTGRQYLINGPLSAQVAALDVSGPRFGPYPAEEMHLFGNLYRSAQFFTFENESWRSYNQNNASYLEPVRDILCVAADPQTGNHAFLGSWGYGFFELQGGEMG